MSQAPVRLQQVICSYCNNRQHHQCPGAIRIPDTERIIVCKCCTPKTGMCTTCGNRSEGDIDLITWYCLDRFACSARVQIRCEQSPLYRMLQDARLDGAAKRRRQRLDVERIQAGIDPTNEDEADSFEVRGRKRSGTRPVRPKTGTCLCCGEPTKGGKYRPGHDAKYKGKLQRAAAAGDQTAIAALTEHGWPLPKGVEAPEPEVLAPSA